MLPVLICTVLALPAQEPGALSYDRPVYDRAAIEAVVRTAMAENGIPGLALGIRRDGEWIMQAGYGLARLSPPAPVTRETRFQIASLTKPITASLVLTLVGEDRFALDDCVRQYLSWVPQAHSAVTVRHLLNHTGGVARDLRVDNLDDFGAADFRPRLERAEPAFEPGTSFQYANTGYILLGFLIEAVEGQPFSEVLASKILEPAGMSSTSYLSPPSDDLLQAVGYEVRDGDFHEAPYYSGGFSGGGLTSSVADLALWIETLEQGRLLADGARELMHSPGRLANGEEVRFAFGGEDASYGMGWFLGRRNGRRLWTHGGAVSGFTTTLDRYPDDGLCVIVLTNVKGPGADAVGRRVAELLLE